MPHVQERFLVHRLVLEDGERRLGAVEQRAVRLVDVRVQNRLEHLTVRLVRKGPHLLARRPRACARLQRHAPARAGRVRALGPACRGGDGLLVRIDAAGEERLQAGVDAGPPQPLLHERVEAEGGQMPVVEDNRMPERDWLRVVGLVGEQVEDRPRTFAVPAIPGGQPLTVEPGRDRHRHQW
jgi:hypothetical protein